MKDKIKILIFVLAVVGFGVWYFLEGTDTPDPQVYTDAESTLKTLDTTKAEAKDCAGLLKLEKMALDGYEESKTDPSISAEQKKINERRNNLMLIESDKHKTECEPKVAVYEQNLNKYKELYKTIKDAEKSRLTKWLEDGKQVSSFPFDLEYSLKYVVGSERFKIPE